MRDLIGLFLLLNFKQNPLHPRNQIVSNAAAQCHDLSALDAPVSILNG
jgi:hypothetical protein